MSLDKKGLDDAVKQDIQNFSGKLQNLHRQFEKAVAKLKGEIQQRWGHKEVKVANRSVYVKYTEHYQSRAVVDFDRGQVTVETLEDKDPKTSLKKAIVTTLLTTNDPQSVDLFSDKSITLKKNREPYLLGLVLDQKGQAVRTSEQAERFAIYLVEQRSKTRKTQSEEGAQTVRYVNIDMVKNFGSKKAERYRPFVKKFSEKYKISPSLVYAIIETESSFNPFAVSPAPAYGLMQLVPTSGGRAAYLRAKGSNQVPSQEYLFDPENNIELGTAYLNVLIYNELEKISNSISRDYCVIAAYNTGPSNMFRTFSKNRATAVKEINSLESGPLYDRLCSSLPYKETRQYLGKVVTKRKRWARNTDTEL